MSVSFQKLGTAGVPLFILQDGKVVSRGEFAAAIGALAGQLPRGRPALNLHENRCAFTMAFLALAQRGDLALLPPGTGASVLQDLTQRYPGALRLDETTTPDFRRLLHSAAAPMPAIADSQEVAVVFTSGSTGTPQAHLKLWGPLRHVGEQLSRHLIGDLGRTSIVATVPTQHMYGLEASIMLPLIGGHAVWSGRPAFPEDIREALATVPTPRVLVTTPVHIRALLAANVRLPPLGRIVSATAPLPTELAAEAESRFDTQVVEIYGCSEAGTIATRRTIEGELWQPIDGMRIESRDGASFAHSAHLSFPVELQDLLEIRGDRFRLVGRIGDMFKVAGKRASLADLTQKLLSIPGVMDAAVFQPDGRDLVRRPAALVVAPQLSEGEILTALGRLVDPVFLPRPLRKVSHLPRNTVGKLPQGALQQLLNDA